jgi:hypothetical protein
MNNVFTTNATEDTLAKTWGYDLLQFAHNNVCGRVLDSCFNGIYENCGTGANTANSCRAHGATTGPFNYNSCIDFGNNNSDINNLLKSSGAPTQAAATCFGYTSASGDPYQSLRGPIADARRSVLTRYILDANADCDLYGEELRNQTTNFAYQKIAATNLLQSKRLEFAMAEEASQLANSTAARNNFTTCLSEIFTCYEEVAQSNPSWTTTQVKSSCSQSARVPACYREMICSPSSQTTVSVISTADHLNCNPKLTRDEVSDGSRSYACRNVTSLSEILHGTGASTPVNPLTATGTGSSTAFRAWCLEQSGTESIRSWTRTTQHQSQPCPLRTGEVTCTETYDSQSRTWVRFVECESGFEPKKNNTVCEPI